MKILIDTQPLSSGHAIRGVGMYTRFLTEELEKLSEIEVFRSGMVEGEKRKYDIVHYPFFDLFFSTLPLLKRAKTVVTIHDVIPLLFPEQYPAGKKGTLAFTQQKLSLKSISGVITDSETSKKDIHQHLSIPEEKIHVVYLAANPFLQAKGEKEINAVRRKYGLPQSYILYVGDINYNKNVPQLIKALRYLPWNTKLVCVGKNFVPQEIPEWRAVEAQLALTDVENRVKFFPNILSDDYEALSAIYSGAMAYVQPSLYEGFGLPVLEAMRCKTPVVSTKNSSLIEVGGDHVVFVEEDARSIANGVKEVLDFSQKKRKTRIQQAFTWQEQFTWKKTAQKTREVYKKVLG